MRTPQNGKVLSLGMNLASTGVLWSLGVNVHPFVYPQWQTRSAL
jgi:hypothetical protein